MSDNSPIVSWPVANQTKLLAIYPRIESTTYGVILSGEIGNTDTTYDFTDFITGVGIPDGTALHLSMLAAYDIPLSGVPGGFPFTPVTLVAKDIIWHQPAKPQKLIAENWFDSLNLVFAGFNGGVTDIDIGGGWLYTYTLTCDGINVFEWNEVNERWEWEMSNAGTLTITADGSPTFNTPSPLKLTGTVTPIIGNPSQVGIGIVMDYQSFSPDNSPVFPTGCFEFPLPDSNGATRHMNVPNLSPLLLKIPGATILLP